LPSRVKEKAIFYFRCDELSDFKELDEVIRDYLKTRDIEGIKSSYIFLDEVTFPSEWYRAIKWHVDMGHFKNDVLVLTGSLSMFVKGEIETFPGRRRNGRDFIMYPLSFREFLKLVNREAFEKIDASQNLNKIEEKCFRALSWLEELQKIFEPYLQCGGFPLSVKSFLEKGKIPSEIFTTYLSWIKGDLAKLKRSESLAKRVIKAIIEKVLSTISFNSIAKEFEIKSHKTVFQYIDILEKLFLAKVLYFIDPDNGTEVFYKQRKIHLTDPFLYNVLSYWCRTEKPEESILVESLVGAHLARKFNIGYWKNNKEVDIVILDDELTGIEVKYKKRLETCSVKILQRFQLACF
jgi:predicted AAA+ superfamily ATPase